MTEKQKKIALITGTVIIALIILLWSRKAAGNTIINKSDMAPINVSIPSMNIPERSPFAINIPGLPSFSPYQFSAISPCMCNGAAQTTSAYQGPLVTFVTNQGSSGPNIYNYSSVQPDTIRTGFTGIPFAQR